MMIIASSIVYNHEFNIIRALMVMISVAFIFFIFQGPAPVTAVSAQQTAPSMFVIGDSLADVGNNNHLHLSIVKADFPHNGIDYPGHKPTGRFSNGKNAADFLAEKVGLATSPPYLSVVRGEFSGNLVTGVSFASGGAGIFDGTDELYRQSIPLKMQIEYYSVIRQTLASQLDGPGAENLKAKAIHAVVIGSNDILGYVTPNSNYSKNYTPDAFVGLMLTTITTQLKRIYDIGGRKFAVFGVGVVGCCPAVRSRFKTGECNDGANQMALKYNKGLQSVLEGLKSELQGFLYSYFDAYSVLLDFIQRPALHGFNEVRAACCGLGYLKAKFACLPISAYCKNRTDHVFWDFYHPTEAAAKLFVDAAFDGSSYSHPINIRQLVAL